jgi:ABC-type uncharacterized transport system permease subunit
VVLYRTLVRTPDASRMPAEWLAVAGVLLHSIAQYQHWAPNGPIEVNFLNVLSLSALVVTTILVLSTALRQPMFDTGLLALPLAALLLLAEWAIPAPGSLYGDNAPAIAVHVTFSILAFGLLSLAGVYAFFVALIDHFLRGHHLNPLVRALPPLAVMETLLFRLIGTGFLLLTVSLSTGLLFVNDLFAQHLAHKSILAITAWLVFGALLFGRIAWGWRGRMAVRLTLAGVALLILAYFGSKLVLEVFLHTSWSAGQAGL